MPQTFYVDWKCLFLHCSIFCSINSQKNCCDTSRSAAVSPARQVLHAQQELLLRDQRDEAARHDASSKYADEVRRQIREKEQLRIAERNAFFEEGIKLDEEARLRRQKLDDIKKKKLDALRSVRVCV